jgi:hypothetical protein
VYIILCILAYVRPHHHTHTFMQICMHTSIKALINFVRVNYTKNLNIWATGLRYSRVFLYGELYIDWFLVKSLGIFKGKLDRNTSAKYLLNIYVLKRNIYILCSQKELWIMVTLLKELVIQLKKNAITGHGPITEKSS